MNRFKLTLLDHEMIHLLEGGEHQIAQAFEIIRMCVKPLVRVVVRDKALKTHEIDDLIAESFVALHQNVNAGIFKGDSSLLSYYLGILKNIHRKWLRSKLKEREFFVDLNQDYIEDISQSQETEIEIIADQEALVAMLLVSLSTKCQNIIHKYYYLDQSYEKIAHDLGYANASTVKSQKYRCIRYLHEAYLAYKAKQNES